MNHTKKTIVSITLALLLAVSTILIASADSGTSYPAMTSVNVSFSDALSIVSDAYPDLKLLSLSLEDENGVQMYQAELLNPADSSVIEIAIDSQSGQVSQQPADDNSQPQQGDQNGENVQYEDASDDNGNAEQNGNTEQSEAVDMSAVKISFSQALSIVSTVYPDRTLFALKLDSENGNLVYLAELLNASDNSVLEVMIDPFSGQVLSQSVGEDEQSGNVDEKETENDTENDNQDIKPLARRRNLKPKTFYMRHRLQVICLARGLVFSIEEYGYWIWDSVKASSQFRGTSPMN